MHHQLQVHNISFSSWSAATPQQAVAQERGCVGATAQEVTLDDVSGHCESGEAFNSYSKIVVMLHHK